MFIDLSVKVTVQSNREAAENEKMVSFGHLGTHFDVMDKEFPLPFLKRDAVVFDVRNVKDRDIGTGDADLSLVEEGMFAAFYTGFIDGVPYGTREYFTAHPQLSNELIEALLEKKVSIIGVDFAGVRRGAEHTPMDRRCAERGAFVVENLCNLDKVLSGRKTAGFTAYTFPVNFAGLTGLPCRVAAEVCD